MSASLLDIAPAIDTVVVGGVSLQTKGISAGDLVKLLQRFPGLREALWNGRAATVDGGTIDAPTLVDAAPEAISAILAAGTGHLGDPDHERAASTVPLEGQLDLLTSILRLTLPQGLGPFVEKLTALFGAVGDGNRKIPGIEFVAEGNRVLANGQDGSITSPAP